MDVLLQKMHNAVDRVNDTAVAASTTLGKCDHVLDQVSSLSPLVHVLMLLLIALTAKKFLEDKEISWLRSLVELIMNACVIIAGLLIPKYVLALLGPVVGNLFACLKVLQGLKILSSTIMPFIHVTA